MNRKLIYILVLMALTALGLILTRGDIGKIITSSPEPTPSSDLGPKAVSDNIYFSIDIPANWVVEQRLKRNGAIFSTLVVQTKDFSITSSKSAEAQFAPLYIKTGANIVAQVITPSADGPHQGGILKEQVLEVAGESGMIHVFKESSLAEGQYIDAHVPHAGRVYLFRMSYNPETFADGERLFTEIIRTLRFEIDK